MCGYLTNMRCQTVLHLFPPSIELMRMKRKGVMESARRTSNRRHLLRQGCLDNWGLRGKVCTISESQRSEWRGEQSYSFFRLFSLIHSLSVAHSQRVRRRWALTFSLNDCSPFLVGWFSRPHCGGCFQTSTTVSGNDRRTSFRALSGPGIVEVS